MRYIDRDENGVITGSYNLQQYDGQEQVADDDPGLVLGSPASPLELITSAIMAMPVAKRTDATWGGYMGQCLLAIQNGDIEALAHLLDNYQTEDADYLAVIGQAKQLFGISGG